MLKKFLIATLLFYAAMLLQASFFAYFSLSGAIPDLVFIMFFLIGFFGRDDSILTAFLVGLTAGFFLDAFSFTILGPSMILLGIFGILLRKTRLNLRNNQDNLPFTYFLPLFFLFLAGYKILLGLYLYYLNADRIVTSLNANTVLALIYDAVIASVLFYFYKKHLNPGDNRQLKLFR